jgi:hypothetical protein
VRWKNGFPSCGTTAISGRTVSGSVVTSWPNTETAPEVAARRVEAIFRNVVFPAPLRPSRATRSPGRTVMETPESASTVGPLRDRYVLRTSVAAIASGMGLAERGADI